MSSITEIIIIYRQRFELMWTSFIKKNKYALLNIYSLRSHLAGVEAFFGLAKIADTDESIEGTVITLPTQ